MYESYRYMHDPYNPFSKSLEEYLNKGRKNHVFYGNKYSVKKDGYWDEFHEFRKYGLVYRPKNLKYVQYQLEKRLKELGADQNTWIRCYININNPDEYMAVMCLKKGSKRCNAAKQIFEILKED